MKPGTFRYSRCEHVDQALALLGEHGGEAKAIAGGQSLVPMMNMRLARPEVLVDIAGIPELSGITFADGTLLVGATTRQRLVERDEGILREMPVIAAALQ